MTAQEQATALGWNSRFVRYAYSQGRDPISQTVHDGSGRGHLYVIWIGTELRLWKRLQGMDEGRHMEAADHEAFDAWLAERYPAPMVAA